MRGPAACVGCARDIDGGAALLDENDLPLLIDYECCAIGDSAIRHQHAVSRGSLAGCKVAEQWEGKGKLLGEFTLGWSIIRADSQNLDFSRVKLGDTSLVSREFLRSTTGEGGREEGYDDRLLSSKIGKLDLSSHCGGQLEVGSHISHFEVGFRRRSRRLSPSGGQSYRQHCQTESSHEQSLSS